MSINEMKTFEHLNNVSINTYSLNTNTKITSDYSYSVDVTVMDIC